MIFRRFRRYDSKLDMSYGILEARFFADVYKETVKFFFYKLSVISSGAIVKLSGKKITLYPAFFSDGFHDFSSIFNVVLAFL